VRAELAALWVARRECKGAKGFFIYDQVADRLHLSLLFSSPCPPGPPVLETYIFEQFTSSIKLLIF
jgi:hypothetical protein